MSKEDIVNKLKEECVSKKIEVTKSDLDKIHDIFIAIISGGLNKEKDEVRLHGIGTFKIVVSKERQGINLHTKQQMTIPKKKRVKFKASQTLLDKLNPELKKAKK